MSTELIARGATAKGPTSNGNHPSTDGVEIRPGSVSQAAIEIVRPGHVVLGAPGG